MTTYTPIIPGTTSIHGKANITIKHNEIKQCKLEKELFYITLEKLSGLHNIAPKSAIVHVDGQQVTYYSTPGGALFPENDAPFHVPTQSVGIRLELDADEFSEQELATIEMVISVIAS